MGTLDLGAFEKALGSLKQSIEVLQDQGFIATLSEPQLNTLRAGVIQNFEFTYEITWKFIKRWLEHNLGSVYVDGVSRRELFRIAAEHQLITDVDQWMYYHRSRNLTTSPPSQLTGHHAIARRMGKAQRAHQ